MTVDICQKSCKVVKKLIQEIFSTMATSAEDKSSNFLRQFRDLKTREFKLLSAQQFMEVWNHYDTDGKSPTRGLAVWTVVFDLLFMDCFSYTGNGFIEGSELDSFLTQLVTSINSQDIGPEVSDWARSTSLSLSLWSLKSIAFNNYVVRMTQKANICMFVFTIKATCNWKGCSDCDISVITLQAFPCNHGTTVTATLHAGNNHQQYKAKIPWM